MQATEVKFPRYINVFTVGPKSQESYGIAHKFNQGDPVMCLECKDQFELDNLLPGTKENFVGSAYKVLVQDFAVKVKEAA